MTDEMTQNEDAITEAVDDLTVAGVVDTAIGAEELDAAGDAAAVAMAATAAGASSVTRAVDAEIVAGRLGALSDVVADAGVTDIAQGVEMLSASEDEETLRRVLSEQA